MKWLAGLIVAAGLGSLLAMFWPAERLVGEPGPVDIGFSQHMSRHHDQAIAMADLYLSRGAGGLSGLASQIQRAQLLELGQMRGWLRLWDQALAPASRSMAWMLAGSAPPDQALRDYLLDCEQASGGMPGLASAEELQALARAPAERRDRLFLELMIRHHEGGLPMLDFAAREARLAAVKELAGRMLADQVRETVLLRTALRKLDS